MSHFHVICNSFSRRLLVTQALGHRVLRTKVEIKKIATDAVPGVKSLSGERSRQGVSSEKSFGGGVVRGRRAEGGGREGKG